MSQTQKNPQPDHHTTPETHGQSAKHQKVPWMTSSLIAALAAIVIGILYTFLPAQVTLGPGWLPLVIMLALLIVPIVFLLLQHPLHPIMFRIFPLIVLGVATTALIIGVALLIFSLQNGTQTKPIILLRTAGLLWTSNVLVFGLWYWEIDGGGPRKRHLAGHKATDFMFPQQVDGNTTAWVPRFFDYLFVAFTGATALSPADTYPLTIKAKSLMMIEASIALALIVIVIGRIVNIL